VSNSSNNAPRAEAAERSSTGLLIVFDPLWANLPERGLLLHECGYLELCHNWNFASVFSPFWRLYWNSKPGFSMDFSGKLVDLTPENLVLIPPHCSYDCWTNNPTPHFWIHFTYHKTPAHSEAIVIKPGEAELRVIEDLKEVIKQSLAEEAPERGRLLASALAQIALSRTDIDWKQSLPANLARLQRHIDEHFGEDLSNPALAKFAGTSLTGLLRLFNRHLGTKPAQYVSEVRVRKAATLLRGTKLSIEEIAEQTGFPNRYYFSRVFKKMTGHSPADFRAKYRFKD
jgi:AraC-like DNA-binding protein